MILSRYSVIGAYNLQKIDDEANWEKFYGIDKIKKEINRKSKSRDGKIQILARKRVF